MSTTFDYVDGSFHLSIRAKGPAEKITLFHRILQRCESDWPWEKKVYAQNSRTARVCKSCLGVVICNPRINAQDIKAAAHQAEVSVKIYRYAPEATCLQGEFKYVETVHVPMDNLDLLYKYKAKKLELTNGILHLRGAAVGNVVDIAALPTHDALSRFSRDFPNQYGADAYDDVDVNGLYLNPVN